MPGLHGMQRVAQRAGAPPSIVAVLDSLRVPEGAQALTGSAGLDVEQIAAQRTRNPAAALHANITGNQTVLDAAARHHRTVQRSVFVSSASVYGLGTGASAATSSTSRTSPTPPCWPPTVRASAHRATVNAGTGRATTIRHIADLVRRHHPGAQIVSTPRPQGDPLGACADITRMREVLGWAPRVGIEDGVERYLAWPERTPETIPGWLRAEAAALVA